MVVPLFNFILFEIVTGHSVANSIISKINRPGVCSSYPIIHGSIRSISKWDSKWYCCQRNDRKNMKLKGRTTTKSAWFGELPWYYDFIQRDISRWYCSQLIMSVWELSISAFLDVMSTPRNEELIVQSLEVTEFDVLTFGFCVWENEIRIYSRLKAFF